MAKLPFGFIATVAGLWLLAERPAYAYIDPGTGSLIYQAALTVILGLGLVLRRSRESITRIIKRLAGRHAPTDPQE